MRESKKSRNLIKVGVGLFLGLGFLKDIFYFPSSRSLPSSISKPLPTSSPEKLKNYKEIDKWLKETSKKRGRKKFKERRKPDSNLKFMANNIIVSGAGTASANGTYTPNTANLASPTPFTPMYAMASGACLYVFSPSAGYFFWAFGTSTAAISGNTAGLYTSGFSWTTLAAAIAAGPQGLTYVVSSGTAPVPTVTQAAAATVPNSPTNLTIVSTFGLVTGNSNAPIINLTWVAPASGSTVVSYSIFRGTTTGGESATPLATGVTGLTYSDTTVNNNTTYFYTAQAVNSGGNSVSSNEATIKSVTIPPSVLVAVKGNTIINLTWTGSTGASSYNIKRSTTSSTGPFTFITSVPNTQTIYSDTGLTNGQIYYYQVTASD